MYKVQKVFQKRMQCLRKMEKDNLNVEISLHTYRDFPKENLVMLQQNSSDVNAIVIHESVIQKLISKLQRLEDYESEQIAEKIINYNKEDTVCENVEKEAASIVVEKEKSGVSKENPIIIDEWDINSSQSADRKITAEVYAQLMTSQLGRVAEENCEGCRKQYSSQKDHKYIMSTSEELLNLYFWDLFENVRVAEANTMCARRMGDFTRAADLKIIFTKNDLRNYEDWVDTLKVLLKMKFKQQIEIE